METIDALLNRVKEVQKLPSDYALAKSLGLSTQHITNWRSGKGLPEPATAVRIAELLDRPAMEILAVIEGERERHRKHPRPWIIQLWERYSPRLLPTIAAAVIVGGGFPIRSHASGLDDLYIMRPRRRRTA